MTLDEKINKYLEISNQKTELDAQLSELKNQIISEMGDEIKHETGIASARIDTKETFKYDDETAMIAVLKEKGLNQYVQEKIITSSLNKELKKSGVLAESLKGLYTKSTTNSITIKAIN